MQFHEESDDDDDHHPVEGVEPGFAMAFSEDEREEVVQDAYAECWIWS